jgi:hypothetical protein
MPTKPICADAVIAALRGVAAPPASSAPSAPNGLDRLFRTVLPRAMAAWEAGRPQREAAALAAALAAATTPNAEALAAIDHAARFAIDLLADDAAPEGDAVPAPGAIRPNRSSPHARFDASSAL